jgi:alkaline phosphatase
VILSIVGCDGASPPSEAPGTKPLRGVVLFVGDGLGVATVTAARVEKASARGGGPGSALLAMDTAPSLSLVRTYSEDNLVTDSGAGMTAMMTGRKVPNQVICWAEGPGGGVDSLTTLLEIAKGMGFATGVVTNSRITHATPAATFAHVPDRWTEDEIAAALVPRRGNPRLGDGIDVVLGGGLRHLVPGDDETEGRADGRNILREMERAGYRILRTAGDLASALSAGDGKIFGVFGPSHLDYETDRSADPRNTQPSLTEMTRAALEILGRHSRGFFLVVEGARIDHALHDMNGRRAVQETLEFDEAIAAVLERDLEETLVLATSDHDHTMVIAGYAPAGAGIFSQAGVDDDGVPYTSLLYATGTGETPPARLTPEILGDPDFRERAGVPTGSEVHGGMDVPLFMWGPGRFLDGIPASMENTEIFHVLREGLESM